MEDRCTSNKHSRLLKSLLLYKFPTCGFIIEVLLYCICMIYYRFYGEPIGVTERHTDSYSRRQIFVQLHFKVIQFWQHQYLHYILPVHSSYSWTRVCYF